MSHVQRWGNSLALRLPKALADQLGIVPGTAVELTVEHGALIVRKSARQLTLADLLAQCREKDRHDPIEWGPPVGREMV